MEIGANSQYLNLKNKKNKSNKIIQLIFYNFN